METAVREFVHFLKPALKTRGRALEAGDVLEAHHTIDHPCGWRPIPKESVGLTLPEGPNVATVICPE